MADVLAEDDETPDSQSFPPVPATKPSDLQRKRRTSGEDRTLRKPRERARAEAGSDVTRRRVADDEGLRDTYDDRASSVARISCSIASRRSRLRSAFFADESLCGLHSRQPARRCLGRPRL